MNEKALMTEVLQLCAERDLTLAEHCSPSQFRRFERGLTRKKLVGLRKPNETALGIFAMFIPDVVLANLPFPVHAHMLRHGTGGVADLKYESSFVMLNVAKRNEASAEILCPADTLR
ncbi:hypothetical protein [Brasilonema sp. UFV-L1]|uniref:hypothetical protein n=1 Tax=Brasilonema sp. UFV-L1 TaxID=2234130 RepID=UPI00145EBED2|nr:hypothetical protein [Brasilonema sp. UFV-L1]NMG10979.1 hypothetical protein [Brasilonema sp. UFV-L1]